MPPRKQTSAPTIGFPAVLVSFVLATAVGIGVFLLFSGTDHKTVTVVGKGQKIVGKELTELNFVVKAEGFSSPKDALFAMNQKSETMKQILSANGVADVDVQTHTTRVMRQPKNASLIDASQSFRVILRKSSVARALSDSLTKAGGVFADAVASGQPTFAHARIRAREEAEADARDRALFLAEKQGKILGRLIDSASEEKVENISVTGSGSRAKEREVTIHVTATYEIE